MFSSPPTSERRAVGARSCAVWTLAASVLLCPAAAHALGTQGDFIQTDSVGVSLLSHDLDTGNTRTLRDVVNLSEYVGVHGYVADRVRLGATLQMSERLWPSPEPGRRIQRFALAPQIGWNFFDPFFCGLVFGFAPRTEGRAHLNLSLQPLLGISLPLWDRVRFSLLAEAPWTFYDRHLIGVTALTGISIRL